MKTYRVTVSTDSTEWKFEGKYHRENGPAIELADGSKEWYINGKRHRENGPAVECADGSKVWYINGKLHRENGPAVELANGYKYWYINGKQLTEEQFNNRNVKDPQRAKYSQNVVKEKNATLRDEIENVLNCNSAENGSDTPDFILAEYLMDCLSAFDKSVQSREKWYGREAKPVEHSPT